MMEPIVHPGDPPRELTKDMLWDFHESGCITNEDYQALAVKLRLSDPKEAYKMAVQLVDWLTYDTWVRGK